MAQKYTDWAPYVYVRDNPLARVDAQGLTDISIHIRRLSESKNSTIGAFRIMNNTTNSSLTGYTLELPDHNNARDVSRIKADTYSARRARRDAEHQGVATIRLEDKNDRENILIHVGNTPDDSKGCILPGESAGTDRVNDSQASMDKIIGYVDAIIVMDALLLGENTTISVTVEDIGRVERLAPLVTKKDTEIPERLNPVEIHPI